MIQSIQPTLLLGLPSNMRLERIEIAEQALVLSLARDTPDAACPLCQQAASRVHSHYVRTLQDMACVGKPLRLLVHVRRFFCENPACLRKIFAERLPDLTSVYARRTNRATSALSEIGFALGGKAGSAMSAFIGLPSNRMTILRMLRRIPTPIAPTPQMLGVDEWAYRRGHRYGTILVNLETGKPVDLLPDHQATTFAVWLKKHPGVQLISRDRAGDFARGATVGAPEAIQSADRFHVVRNLADMIERVLQAHRPALKAIHLLTKNADQPSPLLRHLRPNRERQKQQAQVKMQERYEEVQRLIKQGMSHLAISRHLHLHRDSVIRYARAETAPSRSPRPVRPGILTPHEVYLKTRFLAGERNGVGLYREIVTRGYAGSRMTVERFLLGLRAMEQQGLEITPTASTQEMTPGRAVGLMLRRSTDLTPEAKITLKQICQIHPHVEYLNSSLQHFLSMVRHLRGEELEQWIQHALQSDIPEMIAFAKKLRQDQAAVQVGLTLEWNNGVVEGNVNRLKLIKRSMYGRANFDLLRLRVLHHHRMCA
jgi:transposase